MDSKLSLRKNYLATVRLKLFLKIFFLFFYYYKKFFSNQFQPKQYFLVRYQALTNGECVGKLRFIRVADQHKARPVRSFEILVMDQIANELPLCGGLITSVVQTPLCHTALLSQNRGTPNMALVGVCDEKLDKGMFI